MQPLLLIPLAAMLPTNQYRDYGEHTCEYGVHTGDYRKCTREYGKRTLEYANKIASTPLKSLVFQVFWVRTREELAIKELRSSAAFNRGPTKPLVFGAVSRLIVFQKRMNQ